MKTFYRQWLASALAAAWLTGCSSTGYQKSDAAAGSMEMAAAEVQAENRAMEATLAALDDLIHKPSADLKPQFERFGAALDRLMEAEKRNEKSADRIGRTSAAYFETWDRELASINYGRIRSENVSRKTQVSGQFNTVNRRYRETQAVVQPLLVYLQDIRTALSADLTAGGIAANKDFADNADKNARKVQTALERLADDLADSGMRMSSIVAQTGSAQGGTSDTSESHRADASR